MARKLSKDRMIQEIKNGTYYILKQTDEDDMIFHTLCKVRKDGSFASEVVISNERAKEWIKLGVKVDDWT